MRALIRRISASAKPGRLNSITSKAPSAFAHRRFQFLEIDDREKLEPGPSTAESATDEPILTPGEMEDEEQVQYRSEDGRLKGAHSPPAGSIGLPLEQKLRTPMESSYGHDFSSVRIHSDSESDRFLSSSRALGATSGPDVYIHSSLSRSREHWVVAHELAHVIQQGAAGSVSENTPAGGLTTGRANLEHQADRGASAAVGRRGERPGPEAGVVGITAQFQQDRGAQPAAGGSNPSCDTVPNIPDFPNTRISRIYVSLTSPNHDVSLRWVGPNRALGPTGPCHSTPGAGVCGRDCNDEATSRTRNTCCTPKGDHEIERYAAHLGGYPQARNASYFDGSRGIAFHEWPSLPRQPASHGCVRLNAAMARTILLYSVAQSTSERQGVSPTRVSVGETWTRGRTCWRQSDCD